MGYFKYIESANIAVNLSNRGTFNTPVDSTLLSQPSTFATMPPIFNLSINSAALNSTGTLNQSFAPSFAGLSSTTSTDNSTPITVDPNCELKPGLFKGRLRGQEALVVRLCKKYGVSPALVASVIGLESGYGTSDLAMHNNFMGYRAAGDSGKNSNGFGYFSTIERGLEAGIKNLAGYTRYSDVSAVDFNNLGAIGRHYCEGGRWTGQVRDVYNTVVRKYIA